MKATTLATTWIAAAPARTLRLLASLMCAVAMGAGASVSIPLPFTPVPITLQTFVLYVGAAALGRHYAVLMISGYFAMGIAGAPFFSRGASGIAPLLGPTGGYLAGFFLAALLVGYLAPRARSAGRLAGVLLLASCAIYLCGSWRLAQVLQKGVLEVLPLGVYPFILGDIAKITASITLIQAGRRWFAKKRAISAN